jgi:hypothetical protein
MKKYNVANDVVVKTVDNMCMMRSLRAGSETIKSV